MGATNQAMFYSRGKELPECQYRFKTSQKNGYFNTDFDKLNHNYKSASNNDDFSIAGLDQTCYTSSFEALTKLIEQSICL